MALTSVVDTPTKLHKWLVNKPADWSAAIALRIALRVLPVALDSSQFLRPLPKGDLTLTIFRMLCVSWAARNILGQNIAASAAASAAARNGSSAIYEAKSAIPDSVRAAVNAVNYAISAAADATTNAAEYAANEAGNAFRSARAAANSVTDAAADSAATAEDVAFLLDASTADGAVSLLLAQPLWRAPLPRPINSIWQHTNKTLRESQDGTALWADWYERRLRGEASGFALTETKDVEMQRRLVAVDDAWWERDPSVVNSDLQAWLDELSPRTTDPMRLLEPAPDPLATLLADPQSGGAPRFTDDSDGRAVIDPHAGIDELLTDARAAERHAAACRRAAAVAERLKGHNQADYLSGLAEDLRIALGDRITGGDLAETLLLGNQIRRAERQHANADVGDDILPLPADAARIVAGLVEALNLHIGQQPVLAAMDVAALGPDVIVPLASPDDARQLIADREAAQGLAPRTRDYIDIAASLAPATPDLANRQSRRLSELMTNLGRYVVEKISEHRLALLPLVGGAAAGATLAFIGVAGAVPVLGGAAYLLCNMKRHPDIWMRIAGPAPASRANMQMALDFLEKYWPAESTKDGTNKKP